MNLNNRDLIEAYIEYISASKNLSKNTIKSYKDDLVDFAKFLKFKEVKTIKEYELKKYINYLSSKFSPKSHSRKLSSLKGFFNYLFEFKIKDFNLVDIIEFPKLPKSLPKFLTEKEIKVLLDKTYKDSSDKGLRLSVMLEILYATGVRISELIKIKKGDISEDFSSILIQGKGGQHRVVPLFGRALISLRDYLISKKMDKINNLFLFQCS